MIYEQSNFKEIPINLLGVSKEDKFIQPNRVEINVIEDEHTAEETCCISLIYDLYNAPTKTIFEFGHVAQNVRVELNIDYFESDKHALMLQNAVDSVVQYHPIGPEVVRVLFKSDQRVYLHAIGVAKVSKLELWVAQQSLLLKLVKTFKKLMHYAVKSKQYIKTNGIDRELLRKAYIKTKTLIRPEAKLFDPFQRVFGYNQGWTTSQSPIKKAAVGCSSAGNFFMQEIADLVSCGLGEMGISVQKFDQRGLPEAEAIDVVIIVAPHEFFTIDCDKSTLKQLRKAQRLYMLNTEQPQTTWFAAALRYLKSADKILDMNYQTALRLSVNGFNARFLPLGYSQTYYGQFKSTSLARTGPMEGLPESIVSCEAANFKDRLIDILFVGTESARRKDFFARNAAYFSSKECFIYMPSGSDPFLPESPATIGFQDLLGLAKRSKVILNIHRDTDQYLEWQRIVNVGIFSGAIVVSETCDSNPVLQPAYHYIDVPLSAMLETLDHILSNSDFFLETIEQGRAKLIKSMPISRALNLLFSE